MTTSFTQTHGIPCHTCQAVIPYANTQDELTFFLGGAEVHVDEQSPDWDKAVCFDCTDAEREHSERLADCLAEPLVVSAHRDDAARLESLHAQLRMHDSYRMTYGSPEAWQARRHEISLAINACMQNWKLPKVEALSGEEEEANVCYVCEEEYLPYIELARNEHGERLCVSCLHDR